MCNNFSKSCYDFIKTSDYYNSKSYYDIIITSDYYNSKSAPSLFLCQTIKIIISLFIFYLYMKTYNNCPFSKREQRKKHELVDFSINIYLVHYLPNQPVFCTISLMFGLLGCSDPGPWMSRYKHTKKIVCSSKKNLILTKIRFYTVCPIKNVFQISKQVNTQILIS